MSRLIGVVLPPSDAERDAFIDAISLFNEFVTAHFKGMGEGQILVSDFYRRFADACLRVGEVIDAMPKRDFSAPALDAPKVPQ